MKTSTFTWTFQDSEGNPSSGGCRVTNEQWEAICSIMSETQEQPKEVAEPFGAVSDDGLFRKKLSGFNGPPREWTEVFTASPSATAYGNYMLTQAGKVLDGWAETASAYGYEGDADQYRKAKSDILALSQPSDMVVMSKDEFSSLAKLIEYSDYQTEYDGRMYTICHSCGAQDGAPHASHCEYEVCRTIISQHIPKE